MIRYREWGWLLGINAIACVVVEVAFRDHSGPASWGDIFGSAWRTFVVSTTISSLCMFVVPWLVPIAYGRTNSWARWLIVMATLVAVAMAGSALATALLIVLGQSPSWHAFVPEVRDKMKIAILATLVFGIYTTINQALKAQLDQTTVALRTKERDEAEARRIASEAELASLEARLNPHFLFNTLNSIAALSREDGVRAERMTSQLASLMRSSLDQRSTPRVPLENEIRSVRNYLEIEQVRFGDRLRYRLHIPDDAAHVLVPRMALQTVVENCVKYAVSARREGASVSIAAHRTDRRVCVEVTDDGPGFDVGDLPEGHGLAIVRDRLALLYGGDARLAISSEPGRTTIGLIVPATEIDA